MSAVRPLAIATTAIPAAAAAGTILAGVRPDARYIGLCAAMYALTMLGVTAGFHRLVTHGSFKTAPALRAMLIALGSMAGQGPVLFWAAVHRRHHRFSDRAEDPHSPQGGATVAARLKAFWRAHVGWMGEADATDWRGYIPDLLRDRQLHALHRGYLALVLLGLALPGAAGGLLSGTLQGVADGVLWGGLIRMALAHQATWSVNSLCHLWGRRPFRTGDSSANNAFCAFLTLGEGWHNNHHAFPASVRHGIRWWQLDPTYAFVRFLSLVGVASDLVHPPAEALAARRRAPEGKPA